MSASAAESILQIASVEHILPGMDSWYNSKNGFRIVDLSYEADPRKRTHEWKAEAKMGMPSAEWAREYGKEWIVYDGRPVYGDYDDERHGFNDNIIVPRRARLLCGWDAGPNDVNLAWVLGITVPDAARITWIDEYFTDDGDAESFIEVIHSRLQLEWIKIRGFVVHVADQSVFTKSGVARHAFSDIMRRFGMPPIPGVIGFAARRTATERLLVTSHRTVDGVTLPDWRLHTGRCPILREAMRGGYAYPKTSALSGQYKEVPLKNKFSHIANAMEYACSKLTVTTSAVKYEGQRLLYQNVV